MSNTVTLSPEIVAKTPSCYVQQSMAYFRYVEELPEDVVEVELEATASEVVPGECGLVCLSLFSRLGVKFYGGKINCSDGRPEYKVYLSTKPAPENTIQGPFFQLLNCSLTVTFPGHKNVVLEPCDKGFYEVRFQTGARDTQQRSDSSSSVTAN